MKEIFQRNKSEKKKNENKLFDDNVITRSRVYLEFTFIFLHTYLNINIISGWRVVQDTLSIVHSARARACLPMMFKVQTNENERAVR